MTDGTTLNCIIGLFFITTANGHCQNIRILVKLDFFVYAALHYDASNLVASQ